LAVDYYNGEGRGGKDKERIGGKRWGSNFFFLSRDEIDKEGVGFEKGPRGRDVNFGIDDIFARSACVHTQYKKFVDLPTMKILPR
jgi:hypothetical protein